MDDAVVLLFFSLPVTMAMKSPFLNDIVLDWKKIQCPSEDISAGLILSQEMPANALDDALIPVQKAFFAGIVSHNSNSSTLLMSLIIFFDFSLNEL